VQITIIYVDFLAVSLPEKQPSSRKLRPDSDDRIIPAISYSELEDTGLAGVGNQTRARSTDYGTP